MNTRDLEAFLAVVETGAIVAASARLHLTQPGVSRRIQSLEEQLGIALLDRQSKPLKPTAAGRETYAHGRRVLRVLDDLKTGLSPKAVVSGDFRLGISPYLSEVGISMLADRLRDEFPEMTLCITTGWPEQLLDQLRRSEIDVAAFCLPDGVEPPTGIDAEPLDVQPLSVVAARFVKLPSPTKLEDLSTIPWIINPDGCGFRAAIQRRFQRENLSMRIGIEVLSSDLRLALVARGLGITLATKAAINNYPSRKALRIVPVRDFEPRVRAWIVRRPPIGRLVKPIESLTRALEAALSGVQ